MITRLDVRNFRRVAEAELVLGPDDHLVVIEGPNGAGKSSLVEALAWALTGETRHGRRGLDHLVRRGAELEGAHVVVEFDHAGASWRVERSRVDSVTRAVLYCDGQPVCESPSTVDAELSRIMGMDAAGFRLAVLARQRELAGLTSMDRRARKGQLARLLGVEALSRAAARAHEQMTSANQVVAAMGVEPDVAAAKAAAAGADSAAAAARAAASEAEAGVEALRAEAGQLAPEAARAAEAAEVVARAEGAASAARAAAEVAEREAREAAQLLEATPPPEPHRPLDDVLSDLRAVESEMSAAASAAAVLAERSATAAELDEVTERLATLLAQAADLGDPAAAAASAASQRAEVIADGTAARAATREANDAVAALRARIDALDERTAAAEGLGDVCDRCGQEVSEAHAHQLTSSIATERAELVVALAAAEVAATAAEEHLSAARERLAEVDAAAAAAEADTATLAQVRALIESEQRRESTYRARLARPAPPEASDPAALERRRDELSAELEAVRAAAERSAAHAAAADAAAGAAGRAHTAMEAAAAAEAALAAAGVPEDLAAAAERFAELSTLIDAESELAAVLAERAEAERRRAAELAARADEVADFAARWSQRRADARVAAHAKALLWDCHDTLSSGLRPALESTIAQMVARLSDGRFSEVQVSDDYEVKVRDHTAWRNLSELSGGEQDLVALAVRLALSVVVSERAMGAAPSLLVLDEVFGSQDGLRRETIMSSLRDLRSRWSQVWLISHVGGLAEVADRVVELAVVDDPDIAGETRSDVTVV
jgi:exonuclease SbcC